MPDRALCEQSVSRLTIKHIVSGFIPTGPHILRITGSPKKASRGSSKFGTRWAFLSGIVRFVEKYAMKRRSDSSEHPAHFPRGKRTRSQSCRTTAAPFLTLTRRYRPFFLVFALHGPAAFPAPCVSREIIEMLRPMTTLGA